MANNIYKSAAQVTVFSTIEKTLSFVYRIILSRAIGAEGVGIYQICLSVFAVFLTTASSGIPVTVSRMIAKQSATGSAEEKHAVVSAGVLCTLAFTVPAAVIIFFGRNLLSFLFPDSSSLDIFVLLLPGLILTSVYAVMRGTFWGNKQFLPYSIIELAEDGVMVVLGSILIFFASTPTEGAYFATIAVLVSYIFSFLVSVGWYLHKGGKFVNPKKYVRPLLGSAMPITAMRTSTSLLNSVVATFLPALLISACNLSNSEALAVYGAVSGMSLPVLFIPCSLIGSISVVVAPEMSENFYSGRREKLRSDIEKTLRSSVFIAAALIPVLFTLGGDIGVLLYDNAFSGTIITRFSFMLLPLCLSMITTTVLNSMNCEVKTLIYFFIGALAMLACIFALTPVMGINSYMTGLTASYVITSALNIRLLKKMCPGARWLKYALLSAAASAAACLFGKFFSALTSSVMPPAANIFVCGIAVLAFTAAAFFALGLMPAETMKRLLSRLRKRGKRRDDRQSNEKNAEELS